MVPATGAPITPVLCLPIKLHRNVSGPRAVGSLPTASYPTEMTISAISPYSHVPLPAIASHFDVSLTTVAWIAIGDDLTVSALLLPMCRRSDNVGRTYPGTIGQVH